MWIRGDAILDVSTEEGRPIEAEFARSRLAIGDHPVGEKAGGQGGRSEQRFGRVRRDSLPQTRKREA